MQCFNELFDPRIRTGLVRAMLGVMRLHLCADLLNHGVSVRGEGTLAERFDSISNHGLVGFQRMGRKT